MNENAGTPPAFHPGEALREDYLPELGWTPEELARRLRIPVEQVNEILAERRPVTLDLALRLGRLFNQTTAFWMQMQLNHDLYVAERTVSRDVLEIEPIRRVG